jgi:TNF receptor-associated factor 4
MERIKLLENGMERLEKRLETKLDIKNMPPVIFKLEEFESYGEWDSPPFYTHEKGYKLKVCIDHTYDCSVSMRICLMHGEYDDELVWPFRGIINFELLDQSDDREHKEGTARFMERKSTPKNRRVSADEGTRSIGWGVEDILEHDDEAICDGDCEWYDYIANDTMYIKITDATVSDHNKPWLIQ